MEKETFPDPSVVDYYNANYINYKITIDDEGTGEALAKEFGITAYPTYLFLDKNGKKLHQSAGFKPGADFIQDGRNALDPNTALFPMLGRYDGGDRSPQLLFDLSNALTYYMVDANPKEKITNEYLNTQSAAELESEKNLRFIFSADLGLKSSATQYLLQNQKSFFPLFGKTIVEQRTQRIMTRSAYSAGRTNDPGLMEELRKIAANSFADSTKILSLTQIYFYGGQQDWNNYAKATWEYGNTVGANDWQTLYETGAYLKHFAKDQETLKIGVRIMERVLKLQKNYEHLCIYARLQQKVGNTVPALKAAQEALNVSSAEGEDGSEAKELVAELGK